jgi:hypothetical protein
MYFRTIITILVATSFVTPQIQNSPLMWPQCISMLHAKQYGGVLIENELAGVFLVGRKGHNVN